MHVEGYGKYIFAKDPKSVKISREKVLYVDAPENVPEGSMSLKTVYLLNRQPVLTAYTL